MTQPALSAEDYIQRGAALYMEEKYDAAQVEFEAAIAADPNHAKAHAGLALIHCERDRPEEAAIELERALELDPGCAWAYFVRGNLLVNDSKDAEATVEYLQASWLDPQLAWPHFGLATIYHSNEQFSDAIPEYREAIRLAPNWAVPYHNLGHVYWAQQNYSDAVVQYKTTVALRPTWARAYGNLGILYLELEQYDEAVPAFQRAIEEDPADPIARFGLGSTYRRQNKIEDATAQFLKAISLQPSWEGPHIALGDIYTTLKERKKAISSYQMALQVIDSTQLDKQRQAAWGICVARLIPYKSWALNAIVWLFPIVLLLILSPFLLWGVFGQSVLFPYGTSLPVHVRWLPAIALVIIGVGWFLTALLSPYRIGRWNDIIEFGLILALLLAMRLPLYNLVLFAVAQFPLSASTGFLGIGALVTLLIGMAMRVVTYRIEQEERGVIYSLPEAVAFGLILVGLSSLTILTRAWSGLSQFVLPGLIEIGVFLALLVATYFLNSFLDKAADWLTNLLTDAVIKHYRRAL